MKSTFLRFTRAFVVAVIVAAFTLSIAGAEDFAGLSRYVPQDANALVLVNTAGVHTSHMARQRNWQGLHQEGFSSGMMILPPQAKLFVMASEIDLEFMQPKWEAAVMELSTPVGVSEVARRVSGATDRIQGLDAIELQSDGYLVQFDSNILAVMKPGDRQQVARWTSRARNSRRPRMSPYLSSVVENSDASSAHLVLALDLEGSVRRSNLMDRIRRLTQTDLGDADPDAVEETLSSIRGATLELHFTASCTGKLTVEFEKDASALRGSAQSLVSGVLAARGAALEDLSVWETEVVGGTIVLSGPLSDNALRRVMSVLDTPNAAVDSHQRSAARSGAESGSIAQDSAKYFQAVKGYLYDLIEDRGKATNLRQMTLWLENYSRKIASIPTNGVDEQLAQYGYETAGQLENMAAALRGVKSQAQLRDALIDTNGRSRYVRYGANGFYQRQSVTREQTMIGVSELNEGLSRANVIAEQVRVSTLRIEDEMRRRYGNAFDY